MNSRHHAQGNPHTVTVAPGVAAKLSVLGYLTPRSLTQSSAHAKAMSTMPHSAQLFEIGAIGRHDRANLAPTTTTRHVPAVIRVKVGKDKYKVTARHTKAQFKKCATVGLKRPGVALPPQRILALVRMLIFSLLVDSTSGQENAYIGTTWTGASIYGGGGGGGHAHAPSSGWVGRSYGDPCGGGCSGGYRHGHSPHSHSPHRHNPMPAGAHVHHNHGNHIRYCDKDYPYHCDGMCFNSKEGCAAWRFRKKVQSQWEHSHARMEQAWRQFSAWVAQMLSNYANHLRDMHAYIITSASTITSARARAISISSLFLLASPIGTTLLISKIIGRNRRCRGRRLGGGPLGGGEPSGGAPAGFGGGGSNRLGAGRPSVPRCRSPAARAAEQRAHVQALRRPQSSPARAKPGEARAPVLDHHWRN